MTVPHTARPCSLSTHVCMVTRLLRTPRRGSYDGHRNSHVAVGRIYWRVIQRRSACMAHATAVYTIPIGLRRACGICCELVRTRPQPTISSGLARHSLILLSAGICGPAACGMQDGVRWCDTRSHTRPRLMHIPSRRSIDTNCACTLKIPGRIYSILLLAANITEGSWGQTSSLVLLSWSALATARLRRRRTHAFDLRAYISSCLGRHAQAFVEDPIGTHLRVCPASQKCSFLQVNTPWPG